MIILALTFAINVFILIYYGVMLRVRLIADLCEPLLLFILGLNSPPDHLFQGSPPTGLHGQDYARLFVVEQRHDQAVVVGKEEAGAVELDERNGLHVRLRSWRGRRGT